MAEFKPGKLEKGQSFIELSLILPLMMFILLGVVEVVFIGRTYLGLVEASVTTARLGSEGEFFFNDNELHTYATQILALEGYDTDLVDVLTTRADLINGENVANYRLSKLKGSDRAPFLSAALLQNRMISGDPSTSIIGVEIIYGHQLLFGGFVLLPDPVELRAYTIEHVP